VPVAQELLHAADEDEDPQVHVQAGERWCHMLAPMQTTGLVSTKNVTLMAAAFTVGYGNEGKRCRMSTLPSKSTTSVGKIPWCYLRTRFTPPSSTRNHCLGSVLAKNFEVPQVALEMFYSSLCANAQDYLGRWKVQAGQIGNENQRFLVQHEPTRAILDQQRENGDHMLHLTRQQVQELIVATSAGMRGISGLRQTSTPRPAERECCLLVLNLVSSTLPCIRQPRPRLRVLDVCGFV
jgi:hypothetical protein